MSFSRREFPQYWFLQKKALPFRIFSAAPIDDWRILFFIICVTCAGILVSTSSTMYVPSSSRCSSTLCDTDPLHFPYCGVRWRVSAILFLFQTPRPTHLAFTRYNGYITTHEAFFYLFDSLPLWLSMTLYCIVWPKRCLSDSRADGANIVLHAVKPRV